jgi:hypothetical protein
LTTPCNFAEFSYQISDPASGDCVLVIPNEPDSASRDQNDMPIPFNENPLNVGGVQEKVTFQIPKGSCCAGNPQVCTDGETASTCAALSGTFRPGVLCAAQICACLSNADCQDNNACTDNMCNVATGNCSFPSNVQPGRCCNPNGPPGNSVPIDDGNCCTDDSCNPMTGVVTNAPVADGTDCSSGQPQPPCGDDGNPCTLSRCQQGACTNLNVLAIPCDPALGGADCVAATGGASMSCGTLPPDAACVAPPCCDCIANPPLTIECHDSLQGNQCFEEGEKVIINVELGSGTLPINGVQFELIWDCDCLEFNSIVAGHDCKDGTSPFELQVFSQVNEDGTNCSLFYAVGVGLSQNNGSSGGGTVACISFNKKGGCTQCDLCFGSDDNPLSPILSGPNGDPVSPELPNGGCSLCKVQEKGETTVTVPDSADVNADCDAATALVTWASSASATNSCEGDLVLDCTCSHSNPLVTQAECDALIAHGGEFPQGTATFECCATDSCGKETCDDWTVRVSDQVTLDIVIEIDCLGNGQIHRCIEFCFFSNCIEAPDCSNQCITFGPPWDFPGHATYAIKVPKGQFACVTAKDQEHTLRSTADIECDEEESGHLEAEWKGDPFFGGNWLISGNLDGNTVIDILDFGIIISQWLKCPGPDTCETVATCEENKVNGLKHADLTGDGCVDALDYACFSNNFLEDDKDSCCPDDGGAGNPPPILSITVRQLRLMGLGELAVADLNGDGVLDQNDMEAFNSGIMPVAPQPEIAVPRRASNR